MVVFGRYAMDAVELLLGDAPLIAAQAYTGRP
jgi:hypothetical protein